MTERFGVLGDPRKWKKGPVKRQTAAEIRAEWEEHRALIHEALEGRAGRHHEGERQHNEAAIASYVDQVIADELLRIEEKRLPPEKVRDKYLETFREFQTFCRENGVGWLPAAGPTMFLWLVSDCAPEKCSQRIRALRFMHDVSREYIDERYIAAAERWARLKSKTKKENEDGKENP